MQTRLEDHDGLHCNACVNGAVWTYKTAAKKRVCINSKIMRNMEIGDNMTPNLPIINSFIKWEGLIWKNTKKTRMKLGLCS